MRQRKCYNLSMNKKSLLSLGIFGATTILSFVTVHIMQLICTNKWIGVSVALSLFAVMGIMLAVATNKKKLKKHIKAVRYVVLTVNAIADGLAISSLFTYLGYFPQVWQSVLVAVVLIGLFTLYLAITYIPFAQRHYIISMTIYVLLIIGLCIAWCVGANQTTRAASFLAILYMLVFIAFFTTLAIGAYDKKEHIKKITYVSFVGIVVAIIVLAIISESGDLPLDGISGGANKYNTRHNPYKYMAYEHAVFDVNATSYAKSKNTQSDDESKNNPPEPPLKPLI